MNALFCWQVQVFLCWLTTSFTLSGKFESTILFVWHQKAMGLYDQGQNWVHAEIRIPSPF